MLITKKRTPGGLAAGLPGKLLRRLYIPAQRRIAGRKLTELQAEWILQGHFNRMWQRRFALQDRLGRPYKEIDCRTEFGPELKHYLPYAYWHHLNGTLKKTFSLRGMRPFYFFSSDHTENEGERKYLLDPNIPNSEDHNFSYTYRRWARVPLKEHYRHTMDFEFERPLVIISNKFNCEWGEPPVNYLSTEILNAIVERLLPHYTVVYNRPDGASIVTDHNEIQDLDEKSQLRASFPQLLFAEDIFAERRDQANGFNHLQLCLYAQCERFISVQGGNSVLASYFGGTNLIFQRRGQELFFKELDSIYPRLAGTACHGFSSYDMLLGAIDTHYLRRPTETHHSDEDSH